VGLCDDRPGLGNICADRADLEGCREELVHEVQLQHRGCHGDEHGLQGCAERAGLPLGRLP
jgi:hypothetical protein